MSSLPSTPRDPRPLLIEPANQAGAGSRPPVVPGAGARLLYLPSVLLVLALCLVGVTITLDRWRDMTALQAAGAPATATVTNVESFRLSRNLRLAMITFGYDAPGPDGRLRHYEAGDITLADRRDPSRPARGARIAIRYLPASPATARPAEATPPTIWLGLWMLASAAALVVLLVVGRDAWGDMLLRRRGQVLPGTVVGMQPSLWPRTVRVAYRFTAPDGRDCHGAADLDTRAIARDGAPQAGDSVAVLFVNDGLHTLL